jgi:hypothetical protein
VAADHGAAHPPVKIRERIDKQPFSPIAIPLSGAKLIAWRPQEAAARWS